FADPDYQLSIEWRETSQRVADAQRRQSDPSVAPNILLINGAARSEHTCPGESSKDLASREPCARSLRARTRCRDPAARSQPARLRIRPGDLPLQDLRLHSHAALPLALLLLSQSRTRPGGRLDE